MEIRPELIKIANQIYHDLEAEDYDKTHPEILKRQRRRWLKVLRQAGDKLQRPFTALDVATGTGFAAEVILENFPACQEMTCQDISAAMIEKAKAKLAKYRSSCALQFIIGDFEQTPFPAGQFDCITMNSALHHMANPGRVLFLVDRFLRPGGLFVLAHEPNIKYYASPFLIKIANFIKALLYYLSVYGNPMRYINKVGRMLAIVKEAKKPETLSARTYKLLVERGFIDDEPGLDPEMVGKLVDYHVPEFAGNSSPEQGFDPALFPGQYFPGYELIDYFTYGHLADFGEKLFLLKPVDTVLSRLFPKSGCHFIMGLKKPETANQETDTPKPS